MRRLDVLLTILRRSGAGLTAGLAALYCEGREALLRRTKARTALEELAVDQKKLDLATQRANSAIDLAQRIEKIKDANLRERMRATLFADHNTPADEIKLLPPPDGEAAKGPLDGRIKELAERRASRPLR